MTRCPFPKPTCNATARRNGLSLVEVIVSMLLVGLLLVASMRSVGGVFRTWDSSEGLHRGMGLAQQMMAEILQQHYSDPDGSAFWGIESPESTTDRSEWDDVDDYDGWMSAPQSKDGKAMADYKGWTRVVNVAYVSLADPAQTTLTDEGVKRITVNVTDPRGKQTVLVAYRSRWGALEQPPEIDSTITGYVACELRVKSGARLQSGSNLTNHAKDVANQ